MTSAMTAEMPTSITMPWTKSLIAVALYPPRITYPAVRVAISTAQNSYGTADPNPSSNSLEMPMYTPAVYGMRNTKAMTDATMRSPSESKRVPKKSGIVRLWRCCVISRVRLARMSHARSEPITAFPMPIHVDESPYFQPNCPAYPTNTTAEK